MPAERFDIIFSGKLMPDQDPARAREGVRKLFKASDTQLERLFSGKPVSIKKGVDTEAASRYRAAFRQVGALVDIRPSAPSEGASSGKSPGLTLAPPNSGSLEAYAPKPAPRPLPDISGLKLAAPGTDMVQPPDDPAPPISTEGIELVPGQDWSLEDCQPPELPVILPDIDALDLAAPEDQSHIPPEPPPLPMPDISGMSLEEIAAPEDEEQDSA